MNRIKYLRENLEKTKKDLGDLIGTPRQPILRWEKGDPIPSDDLIKLSKVFGVSTDYILGLTDIENFDEKSIKKYYKEMTDRLIAEYNKDTK